MASPFNEIKSAELTPGLHSWRIEDFKPVKQPKESLGSFYTGDSYILLHTYKGADEKLASDIHFWLGKNSSQDEAGAAAIIATQLDDQLGGKAKQFREVQGAESPEFLQLFPRIKYLEGGVASGFHHVTKTEHKPMLLHVKGRQAVRVSEVPLALSSLNSGDCFVLDLGATVYSWCGADAGRMEKAKALDVVLALKEDRQGKIEVMTLEEGDTSSKDAQAFYARLGAANASAVKIAPAEQSGADGDVAANSATKLYMVSDDSGMVVRSEVTERPLRREALDSAATYALLAGGSLQVWQGKGASAEERKSSMATAQRLLTDLGLPSNTPIKLVKEGFEPPSFLQHFGGDGPKAPGGAHTSGPQLFLVTDRRGVQQLHAFDQGDLCQDDAAVLDAGDAVYLWVGSGASATENAKAQGLAKQRSAADGRTGSVQTVQPGAEPKTFTACFKSWDAAKPIGDPYEARIAALKGQLRSTPAKPASKPEASATPADDDQASAEESTPGSSQASAAKPSKQEKANTPGKTTAAAGTASTQDKGADAASKVLVKPADADTAMPAPVSTAKAADPDSKAAPAPASASKPTAGAPEQGKDAAAKPSGAAKASTAAASKSAPEGPSAVSSADSTGNGTANGTADTPAAAEPEAVKKARLRQQRRTSEGFVDPLERRVSGDKDPAKPRAQANGSNGFVPRPVEVVPQVPPRPPAELKHEPLGDATFGYDELKDMTVDAGIDMTRKEDYLTEEDFKKVFDQDRAAFKKLPVWRQQMAKKKVGLF